MAALALLGGCGCPADSTQVLGPTREPLAAGTREFAHQGERVVAFGSAVAQLKALDQGTDRRYCGKRLAAAPGVGDAAIVADLSRQLGAGWRPAEALAHAPAGLKIYRWQSECSPRFYALMVEQQALPVAGGEPLRLLSSMYACGSD